MPDKQECILPKQKETKVEKEMDLEDRAGYWTSEWSDGGKRKTRALRNPIFKCQIITDEVN